MRDHTESHTAMYFALALTTAMNAIKISAMCTITLFLDILCKMCG